MACTQFPNNPLIGDTHVVGNVTYQCTSVAPPLWESITAPLTIQQISGFTGPSGRGTAIEFIDNVGETESLLQVSQAINYGAAVTTETVPNNTLFRDSVDQKLKYKDNSGVVNILY